MSNLCPGYMNGVFDAENDFKERIVIMCVPVARNQLMNRIAV